MNLSRAFSYLSLPAAAVAGAVATTAPTPAQATCVPDPYVGSVCITAATFCPREYAELQGQTLTISDFQVLYSLIGTIYGGDGRTTFALPDLRGRSVVNRNPQPLADGRSFFGTGQVRGVEEYVISSLQLPVHGHTATFTPDAGGGSAADVQVSTQQGSKDTPAAGDFLGTVYNADKFAKMPQWVPAGAAAPTVAMGGVSGGGSSGGTVSVNAQGGSQPVGNLPPQIAMKFCIALSGLYPPRD